MTDERVAFQTFISDIVPIYVGTVPSGTPFPYIQLNYIQSGFAESVLQSAVLYTNQSTPIEAESIVDLIDEAIGHGGVKLNIEGGGYITVNKGTPFAQHYPQEEPNISAMYLNFQLKTYKY